MPPKVKVTKEEIIAAALEILRQKGMEAVNARAVAAALGCSTQPIFSNYSSMGALPITVNPTVTTQNPMIPTAIMRIPLTTLTQRLPIVQIIPKVYPRAEAALPLREPILATLL